MTARRRSHTSLLAKLDRLRPRLAAAAQSVYDACDPDDEFCDVGSGGICDQVAEAMGAVLAEAGVDFAEGGQDGDDHAWLVAYDRATAYGVDIDPRVYERGGGYSWRKVKGVTIAPEHVDLFEIDRGDISEIVDA